MRATLRQNEAVDIASLPQGVYLLTLQNANQEQSLTRQSLVHSQEQSQEQRTGRLRLIAVLEAGASAEAVLPIQEIGAKREGKFCMGEEYGIFRLKKYISKKVKRMGSVKHIYRCLMR